MKGNFKENKKLFLGTLNEQRQRKKQNKTDKNGNIITDEGKIMDTWREHFLVIIASDNSEVLTIDKSKEREFAEIATVEKRFSDVKVG